MDFESKVFWRTLKKSDTVIVDKNNIQGKTFEAIFWALTDDKDFVVVKRKSNNCIYKINIELISEFKNEKTS